MMSENNKVIRYSSYPILFIKGKTSSDIDSVMSSMASVRYDIDTYISPAAQIRYLLDVFLYRIMQRLSVSLDTVLIKQFDRGIIVKSHPKDAIVKSYSRSGIIVEV